jgi:hypothetical protein
MISCLAFRARLFSDASPAFFLQGKATQKDVDFLADVNAEERDSFLKRNYHNLYNGEMRIRETMLAEWKELKATWNLYEKVGANYMAADPRSHRRVSCAMLRSQALLWGGLR